jgi:hypothetical protein
VFAKFNEKCPLLGAPEEGGKPYGANWVYFVYDLFRRVRKQEMGF